MEKRKRMTNKELTSSELETDSYVFEVKKGIFKALAVLEADKKTIRTIEYGCIGGYWKGLSCSENALSESEFYELLEVLNEVKRKINEGENDSAETSNDSSD